MDNQGILKYIEPADYKSSEGTNVSQQEQNIRLFQTGKPVISNLFKVVEGYYAVVMETPVKNNGSTVGSISSLFKPGVFISNSTNQLIQGKVNDFFVMATDGTMIYDIDTTQIGRNVFTDTLYQFYTDLIKAAHKVADSESGQTDYTFIDNNQHTIINKTVWWKTSDYYGTKWKFCIVKNIN
jgi:hypothetical protein